MYVEKLVFKNTKIIHYTNKEDSSFKVNLCSRRSIPNLTKYNTMSKLFFTIHIK